MNICFSLMCRLLNLKNDVLRKRYDSIKYDMKKIGSLTDYLHLLLEEVVYDISIRGLAKQETEKKV